MKESATARMLTRCNERWYPLDDHPVQLALVDAVSKGVRFPVVPAGRRSGKTERFKRFVSHEAGKLENSGRKYFAGAPTHAQAKRIFWDDLKLFTYFPLHPRKPSGTDLILWLPNGAEIHVVGFDKPERFEGTQWAGGGIDEFGNIKEDAWKINILPALDTRDPRTPDYHAWCWLFGVPEGLNHYYDVADYAENANDPLYQLFHWKSADILSPEVIKAAKRTLSAMQFRQEYEASFESAQGRIYSDYSKDNITIATIKPHEQLLWMHDQNYTPLSSAIGVRRGPINKKRQFEHKNYLYLLDEIILTSAVSRQSAEEFVDKFKDHKNKHVLIYGDSTGRQGEKHGQDSAYKAIEEVLRLHGWKFTRNVKRQDPGIKKRQNQVRAKVKNALGEVSLFVNPNKAPYCHRGLSTVQLKKGSTFLEEDGEYQHVTTAIGYCVDVEWPIDVELKKIQISGN